MKKLAWQQQLGAGILPGPAEFTYQDYALQYGQHSHSLLHIVLSTCQSKKHCLKAHIIQISKTSNLVLKISNMNTISIKTAAFSKRFNLTLHFPLFKLSLFTFFASVERFEHYLYIVYF